MANEYCEGVELEFVITKITPRQRRATSRIVSRQTGIIECKVEFYCEGCHTWYIDFRKYDPNVCPYCNYNHDKMYNHETGRFLQPKPFILALRR